jgi:hypothetical protein
MRYSLVLPVLLTFTAFSFAGEEELSPDERKIFAVIESIRNSALLETEGRPELYLVCIHGFKVQPHGSVPEWDELALRSTIVEVIRGDRKVGDLLEYRHYLDGKAVAPETIVGTLWYVTVSEEETKDGGKVRFVDPQDPSCRIPYTAERAKIVAEHRAYQKQPATATASPEADKKTSAPETETPPAPAR